VKLFKAILYWLPFIAIASVIVTVGVILLAYILPTAQDLVSVAEAIIKGLQ